VVSQFYFGLLRNLVIEVCLTTHLSCVPDSILEKIAYYRH